MINNQNKILIIVLLAVIIFVSTFHIKDLGYAYYGILIFSLIIIIFLVINLITKKEKIFNLAGQTLFAPSKEEYVSNIIPLQYFSYDNELSFNPFNATNTNYSFPFKTKIDKITLSLDNDKSAEGQIYSGLLISVFNKDKLSFETKFKATPKLYNTIDNTLYDTQMIQTHNGSIVEFVPVDKNQKLEIPANHIIKIKYSEGTTDTNICDNSSDINKCPSYAIKDKKKKCDCTLKTEKEKIITVYLNTML